MHLKIGRAIMPPHRIMVKIKNNVAENKNGGFFSHFFHATKNVPFLQKIFVPKFFRPPLGKG